MKNQSIIEGNLGQNATYKKLTSGKEVTRLSIALNKTWRKNGERKSTVDWITVEVWGTTLALAAAKLVKGDAVIVEGEYRTGSYTKNGVTIPTCRVVATYLRKLDNSIYSKSEAPENGTEEALDTEDEETPF